MALEFQEFGQKVKSQVTNSAKCNFNSYIYIINNIEYEIKSSDFSRQIILFHMNAANSRKIASTE